MNFQYQDYPVPVIPGILVIPVPYEDYPEHNSNGFCDDMTHECHENSESIAELEQTRQDGEVSEDDVDRIFHGKTVI